MTASTAERFSDSIQPGTPDVARALQRIAGFAGLERDWDSYDGDPPTAIAIAEASRWVDIVGDLFGPRAGVEAGPHSVAPLADGGVQVEWRGRSGIVELEVGPAGNLGYLYLESDKSDTQTLERDDASWSDVLRILLRVFVS